MTDQRADKDNTEGEDNPKYQRAARLLAQKLDVDWRDLPTEQVIEYMHKIEIARQRPKPDENLS